MRTLAIAATLAAIAFPAAAHHGWAGYDEKTLVTIKAKVEEPRYANPHGELYLTQGKRRWHVILAPVTRMEARGMNEADLEPGTTVTVEGYQNTSDANELRAERIIVNGKTVELR